MSFLYNNINSFAAIRRDLIDLALDSNGEICPKTLMGACAISSKIVYDFLKDNNIDCQIVHNYDHFWCRSMGYTIDLTIKQFDNFLQEIYIEPVKLESKFYFYNKPIVLDGDLTPEYLNKINWPENQSPFTYL